MTIHITPATAETLTATGITLLADVADTNGHLTTHRSIFKPGTEGAPPHLHQQAGELFYVLSGTLRVLTNDTLTTLAPGDTLFVPPNTPHAFEALDAPTEVLFVLTNAKPRFDYYRLLEQAYQGNAEWSAVAATSNLYDNHYVESPTWQTR
ncbi:cupin domain-containing protein [Kribbella sp. NPDC056951]|uniref:cupin domain-containing protein n=1 Tax=Kribbella sp. NPDC056951 TaxID=3345978 RepID=UPI0036312DBC